MADQAACGAVDSYLAQVCVAQYGEFSWQHAFSSGAWVPRNIMLFWGTQAMC